MYMRLIRFASLLLALAFALPAGNVSSGSNTCPSSGTKRIAAASIRSITFTVQAPSGNMGTISIGGSAASATTAVTISGGDAFTFPPASNSAAYDLTQIYFACSNSADSIVYTYLQ